MNEESITSVQAAFYEAVREAARKIIKDISKAVDAISELIEPCIAVIKEFLDNINISDLIQKMNQRDCPRPPRDLFPASVRIADKRSQIRGLLRCRRFSGD